MYSTPLRQKRPEPLKQASKETYSRPLMAREKWTKLVRSTQTGHQRPAKESLVKGEGTQ